MLYFSPENWIEEEKPDLHLLSEVKLIQAEKDPFRKYSAWKIEENGERILPCQVAVTTNSDYIMNIMMKKTILQISAREAFTSIRWEKNRVTCCLPKREKFYTE